MGTGIGGVVRHSQQPVWTKKGPRNGVCNIDIDIAAIMVQIQRQIQINLDKNTVFMCRDIINDGSLLLSTRHDNSKEVQMSLLVPCPV
jgi:hypothetical protein